MSAAIVAICVLVPAIEAVDRWDQTLQDGNDTEATVVIAAVCVGFALSLGKHREWPATWPCRCRWTSR